MAKKKADKRNGTSWLEIALGLFLLSGLIVFVEWLVSGDSSINNSVVATIILLLGLAGSGILLYTFAKWLISRLLRTL